MIHVYVVGFCKLSYPSPGGVLVFHLLVTNVLNLPQGDRSSALFGVVTHVRCILPQGGSLCRGRRARCSRRVWGCCGPCPSCRAPSSSSSPSTRCISSGGTGAWWRRALYVRGLGRVGVQCGVCCLVVTWLLSRLYAVVFWCVYSV